MECLTRVETKSNPIHSKQRFRIIDPELTEDYKTAWIVKENIDCARAIKVPTTYWTKFFSIRNSEKFHKFYKQWQEEVAFESNGRKIIENENYQKIIELGESIIPSIIDKYRTSQEHWSFALRAITGVNMGENELEGDLNKIRSKWLEWATENDF